MLDVAHAALAEPLVNGSWDSLATILETLDKALAEAMPDRESFGAHAEAERGLRKAEEQFPDARTRRRRDGRPNRRRDAFRPRSVASGHPLEPAILGLMRRASIAAALARAEQSTLQPE